MKKTLLFILFLSLLIALVQCKKGDDPFLLLPFGGNSGDATIQVTPADVPPGDLQPGAPPEGDGQITEVTGGSQSPGGGSTGGGDEGDGDKGPCNIKGESLVRHGKDVCFAEGKWFKDANTIFTYQAGSATAGFRYPDLPTGIYEIRIQARHWVKHDKKEALPKDFNEYKVMVAADGVACELSVPASSTGYEQGICNLDLTGGKIDVLVSWVNGHRDVNFCLHSVKLFRIGDSQRSALAAYLSVFARRNTGLIAGLLIIAIGGIVFINIMRRRKASG